MNQMEKDFRLALLSFVYRYSPYPSSWPPDKVELLLAAYNLLQLLEKSDDAE